VLKEMKKYMSKRESTHANVQICPYNEKSEFAQTNDFATILLFEASLQNYVVFFLLQFLI